MMKILEDSKRHAFRGFSCYIFLTSFAYGIEVEGDVWGRWGPENNPYDVIGELRVPPDSTLIIEPGCRIHFQGHHKFIIDNGAVLSAIGTVSDSIEFTAQDTIEGWHGIRFNHADNSSILNYCAFRYGNAVGTGFDELGGAIFLYHSSIAINHCSFGYNRATSGGGIYCYFSNAEINDNELYGNFSSGDGGAIFCSGDSVTVFADNYFHDNSSSECGGAIYIENGSFEFIRNNISSNYANSSGGGLFCSNSMVVFDSNSVFYNRSGVTGGGVSALSCPNSSLTYNVFEENIADSSYGGIYWDGDDITIIGNAIEFNQAGFFGGGIGFNSPGILIYDNIIRGNKARDGGGIALRSEFECDIGPNLITLNSAEKGGGLYSRLTDVNFRGTTISFNIAVDGGGVYRDGGSLLSIGTPEFPCNIYSNFAGRGNDAYATGNPIITVYADTASVLEPDQQLFYFLPKFDLHVNHGYYGQIDQDIYVNPDGDNFNDGITSDSPLKNIAVALIRAQSSSSNIITINIAPGIYSPSSNQEVFPLNAKTSTHLIGIDSDSCIIDAEFTAPLIVATWDSSLAFKNLSFIRGVGAFTISESRYIEIENNYICDNINSEPGGAILAWECLMNLKGNLFFNNSSTGWGGGGAIFFTGTVCRLENNTIFGNHTVNFGGGLWFQTSNLLGINNIFWGNTADQGSNEIYRSYVHNFYEFVYNNIAGGFDGEGNIDSDPMFVDIENGDFHLLPGSQCIDSGDPRSPLDPDGTRADMGAFYFDQLTDIFSDDHLLPLDYELRQNYPNPFNASTTIEYGLPNSSRVTIGVYDIMGRKVTTLINSEQPAGYHQVAWNAKDQSSGTYFYRIQAGDFIEVKKMILLK